MAGRVLSGVSASDALIRDIRFLLYELFDCDALLARAPFADHSRETFDAALETARRIADDKFAPHYQKADAHEPRIENGRVTIIPEIKAATAAAAEAGFIAAALPLEWNGMGLPGSLAQGCNALFNLANTPTFSYLFLTSAAANMIATFGSEEQKKLYLKPLSSGRFFGTMALTEPQAGSGLADIATQAEPVGHDRYRLKGNKIFISGGEHELSQNIVHLVLARIKGAPKGVKGLSLFIVPRRRVNADGTLGPSNGVHLDGLIHKMGWRATTSTILSFGAADDCEGWLLGAAHQGLACMFQMMNEARIAVGLTGAMLGYAGYRAALDYARERRQGRKPGHKDPSSPPIALIEHADVKRMLLAQKSYAEGGLALCLVCARLLDDAKSAPDESIRIAAQERADLLTPIAKGWSADYGLEANRLAIQTLGGYGYTLDFPVQQHYRDNRLNALHEGTNGIQAIDLLGRKVMQDGGAAFECLLAEIRATSARAQGAEALLDSAGALAAAADSVVAATTALRVCQENGDPERALANATLYLDALGRLVVGWLWLRQGLAATNALKHASGTEAAFYYGKLQACRYYARYELPLVGVQAALLGHLDTITLETPGEWL